MEDKNIGGEQGIDAMTLIDKIGPDAFAAVLLIVYLLSPVFMVLGIASFIKFLFGGA